MAADDIGNLGQNYALLFLTKLRPGRDVPYFRATLLGDKFPTFDCLVQLVGSEAHFFLVQVKSTKHGRQGRSLPVAVKKTDIDKMVACPIPTYLLGIDELGELGYIFSMNEPRQKGLGALPRRHLLDTTNIQRLWDEVRSFWMSQDILRNESYFV